MTATHRPEPAARAPGRITEAEFRALYERLRAQMPWGSKDRRGALNYITPAGVLAALAEPRLGRAVSLAAPVEDWATLDNPDPAQHQMKEPLGADAGPGLSFSMDRIAMNIHGNADSHIDALCHVIFDGKLCTTGWTRRRSPSAGRRSCRSPSRPTASWAGGCYWMCRVRAGCRGWSRVTT
jgi:hypothetical protein